MSLVLKYLNPTRSYSQPCTPRYDEKSSKNDDFAGSLLRNHTSSANKNCCGFIPPGILCTHEV